MQVTILDSSYSLSSLCTFPLPPRTTLRGLCPTPLVDTSYTLRWHSLDNLPYFQGFRSTVIRSIQTFPHLLSGTMRTRSHGG